MGLLDIFRRRDLTDHERAVESLQRKRMAAEERAMEATINLVNSCVDMDEPFLGPNGEVWNPICSANRDGSSTSMDTEEWLTRVRCTTRTLADTNEFAICGHENRVNYIVGTGHVYTATAKPELDVEVSEDTLRAVQLVIDEFVKANQWGRRQQEIQRRKDRDGECFLRLFATKSADEDGVAAADLKIRFVEPGQVSTPPKDQRPEATFGIITEEDDIETVLGYYIDGDLVDASEIQHRKMNVDGNVKRGLPLFYPVEPNLRRVEKLLRNMSHVAGIQAAIAMLRKHSGAGSDGATVDAWMQSNADVSVSRANLSNTYHKQYAPGTILDSSAAIDYEFPASGIDASRYVVVIQAELRAVACRLNMPEFMLTADASNANYSSTMVAEGPAVKSFQRWQATMIEEDLEIFDQVLDLAVEGGMITEEQRDQVDIDVTPPTVTTRNRLEETQADQLLVGGKAMSIDTWQQRNELDPEHETELIDKQTEKNMANMEPFGTMVPRGDSQQPPSGQGSEDDEDREGQP